MSVCFLMKIQVENNLPLAAGQEYFFMMVICWSPIELYNADVKWKRGSTMTSCLPNMTS